MLGGPGVPLAAAMAMILAAQKDPLVIDLIGKGISLTPLTESPVYFDYAGNGMAQQTSWIGAGTGFLATLGADGLVDNGTDLITSFVQLATFDTAGDGLIGGSDMNKLVVWQDTNGDGVCQSDELQTLSQLGITSIQLDASQTNENIQGSNIRQVATVTFADGKTTQIGAADLSLSNVDTKDMNNYISGGPIPSLPNLRA